MPYRVIVLAVLTLFAAFSVIGCGDDDSGWTGT